MRQNIALPLALMGVCLAFAGQAPLSFFRQQTLPFLHLHSPTSQKYLVETMGGGVALLDFDGDGRLDIFMVNGGHLQHPLASPLNYQRQSPAYQNRLYRQQSNGTFLDATAASGLAAGPNSFGMGAAVGDIDNDGDPDLFVTGYGGSALYRNNGNGTFSWTDQARVPDWSVSAAFLDYDNDGLLDLFVVRYLAYDITKNLLCGTPFAAYCRPDKFGPVSNVLLHNEGQGKFRDVSQESGIAAVLGKGMGVAIDDYDGDSRPDVFVSNDGMEQFLFHNSGQGRFAEVALAASVAFSDDARTYAGMGAAFGDYDNDAKPDLIVTNLALEKYALYHNEGGGQFRYASLDTGVAAATARSSGWGVGLQDFDNDGQKDIFAAQGHVLDNVERINSGLRYRESPLLLRNNNGKFQSLPLALPAVPGRGAAFGDINNDGRVDVVVAVLGAAPMVLLNHGGGAGNANPGTTIALVGTQSNRSGIGATVLAGTQRVYATASGSYLSANDTRVHLAGRPKQVEVIWPSGHRQQATLAPTGITVITEKR